MGKRSSVSILFATGVAAVFAALSVRAHSQGPFPTVSSSHLQEIGSYVYPQNNIFKQSGERLVVDAILLHRDEHELTEHKTWLFAPGFTMRVPIDKAGNRICVDIASMKSAFRKISLMEVSMEATQIEARIESAKTEELDKDGAIIVAYPADVADDDPRQACLRMKDWIFPAGNAQRRGGSLTLQLRINTGNGGARIAQLNSNGAIVGSPQACVRDEGANGLYNRRCVTRLFDMHEDFARIRITVSRRNDSSLVEDYMVPIY